MLCWATINGAKALGIDETYGSFEKGKSGKYAIIATG
jgi:imidazolonepropionase-like amidohydrolase